MRNTCRIMNTSKESVNRICYKIFVCIVTFVKCNYNHFVRKVVCYLGALSKVLISSDLCHIEYILMFSYFIAVFYGSGLRKKKVQIT
jgi:hypothetical protein